MQRCRTPQPHTVDCERLGGQLRLGLIGERLPCALDLGEVGLAKQAPERPRIVMLDIGIQQPDGGTTTRLMPSDFAMPQANKGPLPPKANSANSRGSRPRSVEIDLMARIMFEAAIRCAP
jgi:hypothetical protein